MPREITIHINGEERAFESPLTIAELIRQIQAPSPSVAVAVNSEIVPHSEFPTFTVKAQDRIEIVQAVGGG